MRKIFIIGIGLLLAACSADNDETMRQPEQRGLHLTTSVNDFEGEGSAATRTDLGGTAFEEGDRIKLKIICPYTTNTNIGETTYGNTFDGLWLMKWKDNDWAMIESSDSVDVAASYRYSGAYNLLGQYEAQQTPYVYTASTWNENVLFMVNGKLQSQYSYIFQADQSQKKNYLKSDLLWAQTYMQTGSYDVHLSFNHVMVCLKIDISPITTSADAVVTLEGMPDIDQREVVVGDYYAAKSKVNSKYGYQEKCTCQKENNGKVLGVAFVNTTSAVVHPMTGNPDNGKSMIENTGVYKAYRNTDGIYYLIVPPCTLTTAATLWIRDGASRYSCALSQTTFEQGKRYSINITTN